MNYCSKMLVISFFIIVLSNQLVLSQEDTHKQDQASTSKKVEQLAPSNSPMMVGPISIKLVNESVISAIKKVAVAAHLKPVLDYDLIKKDKKVNLTFEVASLSEVLDQILQDMEIQYSITESGLLVFTQAEKTKDQSEGSNSPGTIKGSVLDKANGEPLVGANVVILNTSLGIAADIDGNYEIKFVPVGTWKMKVSCIGYVPVIREVTVVENETSQQDFRLATQTLIGEEVVITAQARGQVQAINQQIASNKIANIVSEAKIQELPDFNAAQAISRLPGVSTIKNSGEDQKVVIRGLAPQYNEVAVGGITLASTGNTTIGVTSTGVGAGTLNNDRSVDLTSISPYMIRSIEVFKTLTPDMEANAIGGYVNMTLREAPSGWRTNAMFQSGYTQKSGSYGNYRAVVSASDRLFNDKFGFYIFGNSEQYDRSADNMNANYQMAGSISLIGPSGYRPVRVTTVTLNRHDETRYRYGGNLILDYQLPSGLIKMVNSVNRLNSDFRDNNTILNYNSQTYDVDFDYREGKITTDLAVNSLQITNDFKFMSVDINVANTYSRNRLPLSPFYHLFQNNAISHQHSITNDTNVVPEKLASYVQYGSDTLTYLGTTSMFSSQYKENDQVYKGDFKIPMTFGSTVSGYFKFGGEYRENLHANDQSTPYIGINRGAGTANDINRWVTDSVARYFPSLKYSSATYLLLSTNFRDSNSKLYDSFLNNKFGGIYWACNPTTLNWMMNYLSHNPYLRSTNSTGGWFDGPYQNQPSDYNYTEKYTAGYLMTELDFGQQFMIVGGARYEEVLGAYTAYNLEDQRNPINQPVDTVHAAPWNHYWLPQVQAKYNIGDWADLRYAYTKTLARPDYTQLSPHYTINADSPHQINGGNPKLLPAQADNYDLQLTIHTNELGLLSISGFYKEIKNFTYATSYQLYNKATYDKFGIKDLDSVKSFPFLATTDAGATLNTFINSPYKAFVNGFEADLQTRFWYLPAPLNGVVLGINYTHVWSRAIYPYRDVTGASHGTITWYVDSTRTGRLINQPNDILNASIGYDYKGFSSRLSFVFQGNSVTFIGQFPEQDGYSKDYYRVDFSARQMLPWPGLQLFFDANNLNNETNISAQRSINGFTVENYYGFTANLGIRYEL